MNGNRRRKEVNQRLNNSLMYIEYETSKRY